MKLYYSPGACSLCPFIVLCEGGFAFQSERVDLRTKRTASGRDFREVNPKGYVPALELDDGAVLTEVPAVVEYLADLRPEAQLAPPPTSLERARVREWLAFVGTELHKQFGPLFRPKAPDDAKEAARAVLRGRLAWIDGQLAGKAYLGGDRFSIADAYLYTVLRWTAPSGIDLSGWPNLTAYFERVGARPAVQAAVEAQSAS
jgi:glutathione S-transferase